MHQHDPIKILQISDTHLFADKSKSLLGVNTQKSFEAVLHLLKTQPCDFIIHSGDLAQDGESSTYERFAEMMQQFNVPIYYTPGNHDNEKNILHVYPYKNVFNDKHIILQYWHIILLNSKKPNEVAGFLQDSQLHFLQQSLKAHPELFAMVIFHHHPYAVNCAWLDPLGVENAKQFWDIIQQYPQVKVISFGHIHQEVMKTVNDIQTFSTPSTCIQFKSDQDDFGLEKLAPGYRWIHLFGDGHFTTGVERFSEYVGYFDQKAKGY